MSSFNKVILMGNLTRDPEVRYANNGTPIVKFGLAVNRRFQDSEGNWQEEPTFIDITMFGKRGEAFSRFHTKGKPAFLEGHLRLDNWEDKQTGQKRSSRGYSRSAVEISSSRTSASASGPVPRSMT